MAKSLKLLMCIGIGRLNVYIEMEVCVYYYQKDTSTSEGGWQILIDEKDFL